MKRLARAAERVLLGTGLIALGYCAAVWVDARLYQRRQSQVLDQTVRSEAGAAVVRRGRIRTHSLIGRIQIPRVGLSVMVVEGDDAGTLRRAAGHIPGTALPDQPGNVAIAGHRDTFFRPLRNVRRSDDIVLTTAEGVYHYRVGSMQVVGPDDTQVLRSSRRPTLTLVTCYPFTFVGSAPERFIVQAYRVDGGPAHG